MELRDLGERAAIERLREVLGDTPDLGGGEDDCAAYPAGGGRLHLASTDVMVGPTHFMSGVPPAAVGSYAVEAALSDVAAMGGLPTGVLSAMAMPPSTDIGWLVDLARGMEEAASQQGTHVLGGDTKAATEPVLALTAIGEVEEERCLFRRGGRPGDALVVTGPLGGPAIGYHTLMSEGRDGLPVSVEAALDLVYGVTAHLPEGRALSAIGWAHACIDLSDGLAPAVHQLAGPSGCGAVMRWDTLPLARGLEEAAGVLGVQVVDMALHFGGEFELLAAVDPEGLVAVLDCLQELGRDPRVVGELVTGHEILLRTERGPAPMSPRGFDHFRGGL